MKFLSVIKYKLYFSLYFIICRRYNFKRTDNSENIYGIIMIIIVRGKRMYKYLINGLILGFAYVAPIGMQNIFVINTAIRKSKLKAYQVAFITIFFDISLALSCFLGVGELMKKFDILKMIILLVGSIAVIYIGIGLVRQVPKVQSEEYCGCG